MSLHSSPWVLVPPFDCPICRDGDGSWETFETSDALREHVRVEHPQLSAEMMKDGFADGSQAPTV